MLAVLARPAPRAAPRPVTPYTGDPGKVDFDWDVLRLMVNAKIYRELKGPRGNGVKPLSRIVGISDTSLGPFLRGDSAQPSVRTVVRLLAWLGYTDFSEFLVDQDD